MPYSPWRIIDVFVARSLHSAADSSMDRYIKEVGAATLCMMASRKYRTLRIANLDLWTRQAILQRQIRFFVGSQGEPLGYYCWALLDEPVARAFVSDPSYRLHPSEWNEGDLLWLTDVCAAPGHLALIREDIRQYFAGAHEHAHWQPRRQADGRIARLHLPSGTTGLCALPHAAQIP